MTQSIKHSTFGFGSGPDLLVCEFEPCVGLCADSEKPAWDSLCPSPAHTCALSVSQNKYFLKRENNVMNYGFIMVITFYTQLERTVRTRRCNDLKKKV